MSETAWQVIVKAYQRELENASTPEEKARWQAAIDQSLSQANKEVIVGEGSVRTTPEQRARRIELGKEKKAVADQPRLIQEGKIKIVPAEESANLLAEDAAAVNSRRRPPVVAAAEPVVEKPKNVPKPVVARNNVTDEQRAANLSAAEQRKQAAIDRAKSKRPAAAPPVPKPAPVQNLIPDDIGAGFDDISFTSSIDDESYLASFESMSDGPIPESYFDDLIDDIPPTSSLDLEGAIPVATRPTGAEKLGALGDVVDDLTAGPGPKKKVMFPEFTARVKSVIEQGAELAADVSNDVSKGTGFTTDRATKAASGVRNFVGANKTTKAVIKGLDDAKAVMSGLGTKTKIGIGIGTLGAIGAYSSADRNRRRR